MRNLFFFYLAPFFYPGLNPTGKLQFSFEIAEKSSYQGTYVKYFPF
jgi:hypothetical protein